MCVAVPAKVVRIHKPWADVDLEGVMCKINMMLTPEIKLGDYVLVHAGFAIQSLDPKEAEETLKIWEEYYASLENE